MIPVVVFWTNYTATLNGRVLKLVPCENCSTEYVYVLEREGTGVGTSVYALKDEGARDKAASAAEESLREYLANDFDPVPCPVCGHYQQYMFPKLYETKSLWGPFAKLLALALGCLDAIGALSWSVAYLERPNDRAWWWMVVTWSLLAVLCLIGLGLAAIERSKARRFDPNSEDQQARIQRRRSRAVTRAEFEAGQPREVVIWRAKSSSGGTKQGSESNADDLLKRRIVLLDREVSDETATVVIAKMLFLQHQDPVAPIRLWVDSDGAVSWRRWRLSLRLRIFDPQSIPFAERGRMA